MDAPHYVQGQYTVAQRDAIFAKANKYPDVDGGLVNQVPTLTQDGTIIWRQQSSGGGDGTANANIAIVEDTSTASQAYAIGDLLVYSGQLYRVTAAINIGGTITPGTNVTPTTVADELDSSVAGVSSFNGRTGPVTPQSGDYNASMVGARADDWTPSASDVGALPAPDNTGTVGQVLKKTADGSEWSNESGGGGNDANLAPVEPTSTASQAYAVNSFLVYSGQLYRVTAAITQGDTLTVGTNIAAADVGTYLAMVAAANAVANAGVAPGGYGLGAVPTMLTSSDDLDNFVLRSGWYRLQSGSLPANAPPGDPNTYTYLLRVDGYVQTAYGMRNNPATDYLPILRRVYYNTWGPWEWINPPLVAGTEYRTTERFAGKPVYAKLLDFGALPNATYKDVEHGITNLGVWVSVVGQFNGSTEINTLPLYTSAGANRAVFYAFSTKIRIIVPNDNFSIYTGTFVLKYTKTTD